MKNFYVLLSAIFLSNCTLKAHTFDFHYRGPEDDQLERELDQKNAQREYNEVHQDPTSTQDERDTATERLDKAGLLA